jgi:hypothetical protein
MHQGRQCLARAYQFYGSASRPSIELLGSGLRTLATSTSPSPTFASMSLCRPEALACLVQLCEKIQELLGLRGFEYQCASPGGTLQLLQLYKQLSKARLSALVVSTACVGYVAGSGEKIDWPGLGWTAVGTFAAAASANAWNQVRKFSGLRSHCDGRGGGFDERLFW